MNWGKELSIIQVWTGGQTTESIEHIGAISPVDRLYPLKIKECSDVGLNNFDKLFQKEESKLPSKLSPIIQGLIRQIFSQSHTINNLIHEVNSFSQKIAHHLKYMVEVQPYNQFVQGSNRNINILADLSKTIKQYGCYAEKEKSRTKNNIKKNIFQKLQKKVLLLEKQFQSLRQKNAEQQKQDKKLKLKIIEMMERINKLEINSEKNTIIKNDIKSSSSKYEMSPKKQQQFLNMNEKIGSLQEKIKSVQQNITQKKKHSKQKDLKDEIEKLKQGLKQSTQNLSEQVQKRKKLQQVFLLEIDLLKSDSLNFISTVSKKLDNFDNKITKSYQNLLSKQVPDISKYCEEKNLSQSSQKMEESSSEEKQLLLKGNFSPQDIIKEQQDAQQMQNSQQIQQIPKKILCIDGLKGSVDISQFYEVSSEEFQRRSAKKIKINQRLFLFYGSLQIIKGEKCILLHNSRIYLGITIFFEDPDLSLYPRFINNIFADSIAILFNNSQEKPFQVIHTNMARTGRYTYETDLKKFFYAQTQRTTLKQNYTAEEVEHLLESLTKVNNRKILRGIRCQFYSYYHSLNSEQRMKLTEKKIDIYKFDISHFPVSFQAKPRIQSSNLSLDNHNNQLTLFFRYNPILNQNLAPHKICSSYSNSLCSSCRLLFFNLYEKIKKRTDYEEILGSLLKFFDKDGNSLGQFNHFHPSLEEINTDMKMFKRPNFIRGYVLFFTCQVLPNQNRWREKLVQTYGDLKQNLLQNGIFRDSIIRYGVEKIIYMMTLKIANTLRCFKDIYYQSGCICSPNQQVLKMIQKQILNIFGVRLRIISPDDAYQISQGLIMVGDPVWVVKAKYLPVKKQLAMRFGREFTHEDIRFIRQNYINWKMLDREKKLQKYCPNTFFQQNEKSSSLQLIQAKLPTQRSWQERQKNKHERSRSREKLKANLHSQKNSLEPEYDNYLPRKQKKNQNWKKFRI